MATLGCAGLRAHELCDLNVEDADIVLERLNVRDASRSGCGSSIRPRSKGVLADYLARRGGAVGDPPFPTETEARRTPDNLRQRVFHPVIEHARQAREARRHPPLPDSVTPRTCAAPTARYGSRPSRRRRSPGSWTRLANEKPDTLCASTRR
jgi:hypothetical protein